MTMKQSKELEINYMAYTLLLIRQKLPLLLLGLIVVGAAGAFVFKNNIMSNKKPAKTTKVAQKNVKTKTYTVSEGEDLWQIAEKMYGSGFNSYDIAKANNLKEPYILQKGQVLVIPDVSKRSPTKGGLTPEAAQTKQVTNGDRTYTVQEGDYLFDIAQRAYGDGNMMYKIIDANNIPPPYNIEAGQVLTVPR